MSLHLESKILVEHDGRVVRGDVEDDVLPGAGLDEVVKEELGQSSPTPLGMGEQEGDVRLWWKGERRSRGETLVVHNSHPYQTAVTEFN